MMIELYGLLGWFKVKVRCGTGTCPAAAMHACPAFHALPPSSPRARADTLLLLLRRAPIRSSLRSRPSRSGWASPSVSSSRPTSCWPS
jgi:hypothetical protein